MSLYTPYAGLLELDPGEPISLNNYEFYTNESIIDSYIHAFLNHRHNGAAAMTAVASGATHTVASGTASGQLAPGTTWYFGITALDVDGGETIAASSSAATIGGVNNPTVAPVGVAGTGGSLNAGAYRYAYTFVDSNGETLSSPQLNISVGSNGKVTLTLPVSSLTKRVYRAFGYSDFRKVSDVAASSTILVDDGTLCVNCDQIVPESNTAGAANQITVTRPTLPSGAVSWRVYASQDIAWPSPSLWASAVGQVTNIPSATTVITFRSIDELRTGSPPVISRTIPGASLILAQDILYAGPAGGFVPSGSVENALDTISQYYIGQIFSTAASGPSSASAAKGWNVGFDNMGGMEISITPAASAVRFRAGMSQVLYRPISVNTPDSVTLQRQDWTYVYGRGVRASAYSSLQNFHKTVDIGTVTDYRFITPSNITAININEYIETYIASGMTVASGVTMYLPGNAYDGYTVTMKRYGSANSVYVIASGGYQIERGSGSTASARYLYDKESLTLFWVSSMQTWLVK